MYISHDWYPTLCELAGAEMGDTSHIDGVSLVGVLNQDVVELPRSLYWHFPHYRYQDEVPYSVIRQDRWKLIKRYQGKRYELFDLAEDPGETIDLALEFPDTVSLLDGQLAGWLGEVGAALPKQWAGGL